uniref:Ig-like domain-containing protein n=1 Tax=Branchiostoma floridae TaxID=7739 RepID=C3ZAB1_BRAFL|eukprot:XP_002594493.1 hypothetical protein BRAFLDRAFT_87685 [Branchiostoma floridae]
MVATKTAAAAVLLVLLALQGAGGCPKQCKCDAKTQEVACAGKGLTEIPFGLPVDSKRLIITDNNIAEVTGRQLSKLSLLEYLELSNNKISKIHSGAFKKLVKLRSLLLADLLSLRGSQLSSVPVKALRRLRHLKTLILTGLPIKRLMRNSFKKLPKLEELYLNNMELISVSASAFYGLKRLKILDLSKNKLTTLYRDCFGTSSVPSLQVFNLADNDWNCNCELQWLMEILRTIPESGNSVNCEEPRNPDAPDIPIPLRNMTEQIAAQSCKPPSVSVRIGDPDGNDTVKVGTTVVIHCNASGDPKPIIEWGGPWGHGRLASTHSEYEEKSHFLALGPDALVITEVKGKDSGNYTCFARNGAGTAQAIIQLRVQGRMKNLDPEQRIGRNGNNPFTNSTLKSNQSDYPATFDQLFPILLGSILMGSGTFLAVVILCLIVFLILSKAKKPRGPDLGDELLDWQEIPELIVEPGQSNLYLFSRNHLQQGHQKHAHHPQLSLRLFLADSLARTSPTVTIPVQDDLISAGRPPTPLGRHSLFLLALLAFVNHKVQPCCVAVWCAMQSLLRRFRSSTKRLQVCNDNLRPGLLHPQSSLATGTVISSARRIVPQGNAISRCGSVIWANAMPKLPDYSHVRNEGKIIQSGSHKVPVK